LWSLWQATSGLWLALSIASGCPMGDLELGSSSGPRPWIGQKLISGCSRVEWCGLVSAVPFCGARIETELGKFEIEQGIRRDCC
jgi:hypothetical protein